MGCASLQQQTGTVRSAAEQLLLTQAIERSLAQAHLPMSPGTEFSVEAIGLTPPQVVGNDSDKEFAKELVDSWLLSQGFRTRVGAKEHKVRVIIQSLGTQQAETFIGIPAISSYLIPFALPELALFKVSRQRSLARFKMDVIDVKTGGLVYTTPLYEGDAYLYQYVLLFGFTFHLTDLVPPPPSV
ncbi:hypothetical protein [Petrachloros mirabilis]